MSPGNMYRHPRCLDVDIFIASVVRRLKDSTEYAVHYWNRAGFMHDVGVDVVTIKDEDLANWTEVKDVRQN